VIQEIQIQKQQKLIESIVRHHIVELLRRANMLAQRRNSRMTIDDIIFQIRKDTPKLNRLKEFLSWKDLRKRLKNTEKPSDDVSTMEDVKDAHRPAKRRKIRLPWDFLTSIKTVDDDDDDEENELETREMDEQNKERLRLADEVTKVMTKEQYMEYSECRQASFTYKKAKKFREWVDCPMNDDILEVLGYLAWEVVGLITQTALETKQVQENGIDLKPEAASSTVGGLFNGKLAVSRSIIAPGERGEPLQVKHIHEAMRRLKPLCHSLPNELLIQGRSNWSKFH